MVRAAALTAVSASISTPVRSTVAATASMRTAPPRSSSSKVRRTAVSGSVCAIGIHSSVRLAAATPATCATARTSPFAMRFPLMSLAVCGFMWTSPRATAWRREGVLPDTSTMRARPLRSTCVSLSLAKDLDLDLTALRRGGVGGDDDNAIGANHRGHDRRSAGHGGGPEGPVTLHQRDTHMVLPIPGGDGRGHAGAHSPAGLPVVLQARKGLDHRTDELVIDDQCRDDVAGEAEHRLPVREREDGRLPGLDGDPVDDDPGFPERRDGVGDNVPLTHGTAPREDHHVRVPVCVLRAVDDALQAVTDDPVRDGEPPTLFDVARERVCVHVVDLPGAAL